MMNSKLISWTAGALAALSMLAVAVADDVETITKMMQKLVPGMAPDRIVESPMPGLYEVSFGPDVLYVTKDGRYALQGDLIDVASKANLSEARRAQGRVQLIKGLNEKDMIIFAAPPKQEKHVVTIFTDVDCAYCRKMHGEMADYNKAGITVRYLAFPRSGVDTPSYYKMVGVWCAKDRRAAMTRAKLGEAVEQKTCDNPVKKHLAAAERVGVSGTPTMVLEDGTVVPGYMPAARLSQALDQLATAAR
ncbi:MAG: thioredoxin fold domain-containing protein [Pseudomonadota bacterium]